MATIKNGKKVAAVKKTAPKKVVQGKARKARKAK